MTEEKKIDHGGSAFGLPGFTDMPGEPARTWHPEFGMTRRQWLAGLAMQAMITGYSSDERVVTIHTDKVAKSAFDMADALIAFESQELKSDAGGKADGI